MRIVKLSFAITFGVGFLLSFSAHAIPDCENILDPDEIAREVYNAEVSLFRAAERVKTARDAGQPASLNEIDFIHVAVLAKHGGPSQAKVLGLLVNEGIAAGAGEAQALNDAAEAIRERVNGHKAVPFRAELEKRLAERNAKRSLHRYDEMTFQRSRMQRWLEEAQESGPLPLKRDFFLRKFKDYNAAEAMGPLLLMEFLEGLEALGEIRLSYLLLRDLEEHFHIPLQPSTEYRIKALRHARMGLFIPVHGHQGSVDLSELITHLYLLNRFSNSVGDLHQIAQVEAIWLAATPKTTDAEVLRAHQEAVRVLFATYLRALQMRLRPSELLEAKIDAATFPTREGEGPGSLSYTLIDKSSPLHRAVSAAHLESNVLRDMLIRISHDYLNEAAKLQREPVVLESFYELDSDSASRLSLFNEQLNPHAETFRKQLAEKVRDGRGIRIIASQWHLDRAPHIKGESLFIFGTAQEDAWVLSAKLRH